jgi:DNA-binding response OmpR family regulator
MSKLVMVIDDSLTVRKILEVALRREGVDVVTYADGVEALRTLKAQPHLMPAVIFIDICMPHMDGYTVLRLLRANSRFDSTMIVMLSKRDGVMDRLKGRLAGATVYMTKPFKRQEILSIVLPHLSAAALPTIDRTRDTDAIARVETKRRCSLLDFAVATDQVAMFQAKRDERVEHPA